MWGRYVLICGPVPFSVACVAGYVIHPWTAQSDFPQPTTNELGQRCFEFSMPPVFVNSESRTVWELPVVNNKSRELRILDVKTSCGCTKSELAKKELGPNERTTLVLEPNLRNRAGPFRLSCQLKTDDEQHPEWLYSVTTVVFQTLAFMPKTLYVGMMEKESQRTTEANLLMTIPPEAEFPRLESVTSSSESLAVETLVPVTEEIPGARQMRIPLKLIVKSGNLTGAAGAVVRATCVSEAGSSTAELPVNWSVQSAFSVSPSVVFFGKVGGLTSAVKRQVVVRRTDGQKVRVTGISSTDPAVDARVRDCTAGYCIIERRLQPTKVTQDLVGYIRVETDHAIQRYMQIEFSAIK